MCFERIAGSPGDRPQVFDQAALRRVFERLDQVPRVADLPVHFLPFQDLPFQF